MIKHKKSLLIAIASAILLMLITSLFGFFTSARSVREEVLRLHVLANSDAPEDQALKLEVRDALLMAGKELFDGTTSVENARERLAENQAALQSAGEEVIKHDGKNYSLSVYVTEEYFNTRSYGDITLPAGKYTAVKAVIGEGEGQNWWCVMFPPLCLPAAQTDPGEYFDTETLELIESDPKIEVRFKLLEWAEALKDRWF